MPLHPQAQVVVDLVNELGLMDPEGKEPRELRAALRSATLPSSIDVATVEDLTIDGRDGPIPVRAYRPGRAELLPLVVYLHGGGWVIGDLETHDNICRMIADATPCAVLSVDYRLAPEHPFPAAVHDAIDATRWASDHADELGADPARLAVAGDSAGGNLAAVVALDARDSGGPPIAAQLLVYPATDNEFESPSMIENASGYFLEVPAIRWFHGHYLSRASDADDWRASPIRAASLAGLPPALVITAQYDPLRDQGRAYAERLAAEGTPAEVHDYDGMFHGFFGMNDLIEPAAVAFDDAVGFLRRSLAAEAVSS